MKLFFCGDVVPGGVLPYQDEYMDSQLREYLRSFDFRVGTLECAVGTNLPYDEVKMQGRQNIVYIRDEDFFRVKEMGFDLVSLANNHVWDLGEEGLKNTIRHLKDNGILYCGAGMNIEEASRPAVIEREGMTIAFYAYCMYNSPWLGYVELAGEGKPGVNPLDIDRVESDIRVAKKQYDKVIVLPHWGRECSYKPSPECVEWARRMVAAGADAVFGSHTHSAQPLVTIKGTPVCFSMGNFLFPDFYMYPPRPIWYPGPDVDRTKIKDVSDYPFPVIEPVRQVSAPIARVGWAISATVNRDKMSLQPLFVRNSNSNILSFGDMDSSAKKSLREEYCMVKYPILKFPIKLVRKIRKIVQKQLAKA